MKSDLSSRTRHAVATGLGVLVLAATLGAAVAATAETGDVVDDHVIVVYEAVLDASYVDPDGARTPAPVFSQQIFLDCEDDGCTLTMGIDGIFQPSPANYAVFDSQPSFTIPGSITMTHPRSGDVCLGGLEPGWTEQLDFTATGVAGSGRAEAVANSGCPNTPARVGSEFVIVSSTVIEGECYFTADGCAVAAPAPTVSAAGGASAPATAPRSTSQLSSGSAAAPSVLSALATPADAGTAPAQVALAALLTVILVLLVAFPTSLLNSAVESGSDRFSQWWAGRRKPVVPSAGRSADDADTTSTAASSRSRSWWWAAAGVLIAGLMSGFVDPQFGFNPGSLRVLLSILVSFGIDVVLGWVLVIWLVRRVAPSVTHSFVFKPLTLLVVVAAVVFTRVTGFEPGIVFGLVAGVAFGALVGRGSQAKAALATLGYAFGIAMVAWILYGALGGGGATGGSFWQTFAVETLSSIAIGGMAALPVALFPLRGMVGRTIWEWSRWIWAGCYAVGLFAFFIVLMPMPFSWESVPMDLWTWIAIYLVYAIGAILAWLAIARQWRSEPDPVDKESAESPIPVEPG